MLTAIPRYGARVHPTTQQMVAACRERGEFVEGPHIDAFEQAFASRLGAGHAAAVSFGRMAFYFILKALQLPVGCGDRRSGAHVLDGAGNRARGTPEGPIRRCRSRHVLPRSGARWNG